MKNCKICNKEFNPITNSIYCNRICSYKAMELKAKERKIKKSVSKIRLLMPFQGWCLFGKGIHKHYPLLGLLKGIKERDRYNNQKTKCFCPKCELELCSSDSFLRDTDFVYYRCRRCKTESKWDFDSICPILLSNLSPNKENE